MPDELPEGEFAFLYTIPTFQNPSGRTLSVERRRRLAELARERELLVLEDDPVRPRPLRRRAAAERVRARGRRRTIAYCSSFSKTVAPGLRVGWFVLPPQLAQEIEAFAVSTYISPPYLSQATVLEFARRGSFEPNLERVNGLLRERRDAMLEALEREMPEDASWTRPEGGYFVWLDLPSGPTGRGASRPGGGGGGHVRQGQRLLPRWSRAASGRCASPSASSRRTRSPRASQCSGVCVRAAAPAAL